MERPAKSKDKIETEIVDILYLKLKAEKYLYEFFKQAWPWIEGVKPFIEGWAVGALCEHVQALVEGQISKLLINLPPRVGKSNVVSVALVPWIWTFMPSLKALYASYKMSLAMEHSRKCRMLLDSPWYKRFWKHSFSMLKDQSVKSHFTNDKYGHRITGSTSLEAGVTGFGGDLLVLDDPNKAGESAVTIDAVNTFVSTVWSNRMDPGGLKLQIIMQQRTAEEDVSGMALAKDAGWTPLILPMEYEKARHCKTIILPSSKGLKWEDPRKKDGELLWPKGINQADLNTLKKETGQYNYACQFQQRPAPEAGGIIKKDWFKWWKQNTAPVITNVIQCWDTAIDAKSEGSFSASTTWGVYNDTHGTPNIILLGLWMDKAEYPDLRRMALRLSKDYRDSGEIEVTPDGKHVPDLVLIESKSTGPSVIYDLRRAGVSAIGFDPSKHGDKLARTRKVTPLMENGRIWVPAKPPEYYVLRPFADKFVNVCGSFPDKSSLDVVDTLSMCLIYLQNNGYLYNPGEEILQDRIKPKKPFYGPGSD